MKKGITLLLLLINFIALAQETTLADTVKDELHYNEDDYFDFDVKVLPNNPKLAVIAMAKYNGIHDNDGSVCDLILLLMDANSHKIIDRYEIKDAYVSDAYHLSSVTLDVANYAVADGLRAFGVKSTYEGSSRVFPSWDSNIALFIIKDNKLTKILDEFRLDQGNGDWDQGNCRYDGEETTTVLIMDKEKTNDYYNIKVKRIKATIKRRDPKKEGDNCIETKIKQKPIIETLQFVKGSYQLKKK